MAKFIIEVWLDGYDSEEEMEAACPEFIEEMLNSAGTTCRVISKVEEK